MDDRHLSDDLLLDLVNGFASEIVTAEALEHLRVCPTCEERFRARAALHERARARAAETLRVDGRRPHVRQHRALEQMRPLLVAAGLVILIGAALLMGPNREPRPDAGAVPAWLPAADPSVFNRDPEEMGPDSLLVAGLQAYSRRDLASSRALLEAARTDGPQEMVRRVYLGNIALQLGQPQAAIEALRGLDMSRIPDPWRAETEWTLAVAYERTHRHDRADSLFGVLAQRPDTVGARARLLRRGSR